LWDYSDCLAVGSWETFFGVGGIDCVRHWDGRSSWTVGVLMDLEGIVSRLARSIINDIDRNIRA
jgi:hypothetical protein